MSSPTSHAELARHSWSSDECAKRSAPSSWRRAQRRHVAAEARDDDATSAALLHLGLLCRGEVAPLTRPAPHQRRVVIEACEIVGADIDPGWASVVGAVGGAASVAKRSRAVGARASASQRAVPLAQASVFAKRPPGGPLPVIAVSLSTRSGNDAVMLVGRPAD